MASVLISLEEYQWLKDEVELLREALQKIDELKPDEEFGAVPIETAQLIARAALKEKSDD